MRSAILRLSALLLVASSAGASVGCMPTAGKCVQTVVPARIFGVSTMSNTQVELENYVQGSLIGGAMLTEEGAVTGVIVRAVERIAGGRWDLVADDIGPAIAP